MVGGVEVHVTCYFTFSSRGVSGRRRVGFQVAREVGGAGLRVTRLFALYLRRN